MSVEKIRSNLTSVRNTVCQKEAEAKTKTKNTVMFVLSCLGHRYENN
jgi:hypothetical protein